MPSGRKHPTHAHHSVLLHPSWSSPHPPGAHLSVKGGEEEEEQEEEHPQHGQGRKGGGCSRGDACPRGSQCPVPLGEDGFSGPAPLPWAHQTKLVGAAGAKEDLQGQPWVSQQELQHAGLHTNGRGQLVHVGDVICLQRAAAPVPSGREERKR